MNQSGKKWALFLLRWGIAVGGIWWVVANITLRDQVTILDEEMNPQHAFLSDRFKEDSPTFEVFEPGTGKRLVLKAEDVISRPEKPNMPLTIKTAKGTENVILLGLDLNPKDLTKVNRLLVSDHELGGGKWIKPWDVVGRFQVNVPHPRVDVGVMTMIWMANPLLLWAAVLIFPITYIITSIRWHALLRALDIHIATSRTFVINMVGAFYNTFMPGSTGGDLLKAYYASKQTPHRTQAVLSVLVDRIIGLLALVLLGGTMAAYQYMISEDRHSAAAIACGRVALGAMAVMGATLGGLGLVWFPAVRRRLGMEFVMARLPLQKHVQHVRQVMRIYRGRPVLVLWALVITLPVHITVVISAMLAGKAFGLPLPSLYYSVAVPVIVLSGALPVSPQGAGVMEFFAIQLTKQYGVTISQAFALTMSIRMVQIFWNLTGGIFVLRGGFHAPTQQQQEELERDEQEAESR